MRHAACLAAALLAACASPMTATSSSPLPPASLNGTKWVASGAPADAKNAPRIEFVAEGRVSGYTGCNMFSGTWRVEGAEVRLGTLAATKRACLGPEGDAEKRFLAAAGDQARVRREGGRIVIEGAGGARFEMVEAR